jgi:hypothetical protein
MTIDVVTQILRVNKVHADSSTFAEGMSKKEVYAQVLEQAKALFEGQRNWVCIRSCLYE